MNLFQNKKSRYACLLFLIFPIVSLGQKPNGDLASYQKKYNTDLVCLNNTTSINITLKNDKINIEKTSLRDFYYLNKFAPRYQAMSLNYEETFSNISDIEAYSLIPDGKGGFDKLKVNSKDIQTKKIISGDVFYDGQKSKYFDFPSLQKGSISHLKFTKTIKDPHFFGRFFFAGFYPVESKKIVIKVDNAIQLDFTYFHCKTANIDFKKIRSKKTTTYIWKKKDIPAVTLEDQGPSFSHTAPLIIVRIVQYKDDKGNIVPVYRNLKDLYDWDKNFLSKVINGDNSFAKPLVDSIIKKCHSKKEIVSGIYKWVQKNISYIAIENGLGGFIPRSPDTVFQRRYGDCKDMTCLLVSMLKAANIDAHYVWIGTRDIPYDYNKVPTSYSANHMVVAWKDKGKYHFLDATSDYLPFGYPSTFIQDKIALIYVNDNKYDTVRVPITPAEANKQIHRIHFTLNDDKLEGSDSAYVIGYLAGNIKRTYATLSSNDKHDHWQNWFQVGNNTYTLEENSLTINPSDTATLSCKFHISNYAVKVGDEIYINPILDRKWNGSIIPAKRKAPYISDEKYAIFNQYIFTIPEGYTLKFLPKGGEDNQANFSFKITYKKIGQNKVIATYKLIINELNTEPENFDSWNTFAKKLKKITNQNIILKKN